jgi:hypothetical protein
MVFVVEDDQSVREALASLIRSAGWNTEVFLSAERRAPVEYQRTIRLYTKVQLATPPRAPYRCSAGEADPSPLFLTFGGAR